MKKMKIKDITLKNLVRKDLGDLQSLADSIKRFGLLQAVGITSTNELVFGRRRLEAHKLLGLEDIEVRIIYDRN